MNAINFSDYRLFVSILEKGFDGFYIFVCQLCHSVIGTFKANYARMTALFIHILHIVFWRSGKNVTWVTTTGIIAMVASMKPFWERTVCKFIGKPMGIVSLPMNSTKAISSQSFAFCPFPTFIGAFNFYFRPENALKRTIKLTVACWLKRVVAISTVFDRVIDSHFLTSLRNLVRGSKAPYTLCSPFFYAKNCGMSRIN